MIVILLQPHAGLPDELLGQRIVAHPALDPAARLALFRSCHALARMVLLHAPSSGKRLTHHVKSKDRTRHWSQRTPPWRASSPPSGGRCRRTWTWSCAWSPPYLRREQRPPGRSCPLSRPRLPSPTLCELRLTAADLAAWQLHDPTHWPRLQHLTIQLCGLPLAATVAAAPQPLPPIPRLQSFTWTQGNSQDVAALLPLAAHAERARLATYSYSCMGVVEGLHRLRHLRLERHAGDEVLRALLQHPALEHLTLASLSVYDDLSRQPCRWRTLTMAQGLGLREAALLPLAGLERLTIGRGAHQGGGDQQQCAAAVATLQRLHGERRLALVPETDADTVSLWGLLPGDGLFDLSRGYERTPALLRLLVEAGQGVNALVLWPGLPLPVLRGEVVPLPGRQGAGIQTLCVDLSGAPNDQWCAGLLGALPACITRVEVCVFYTRAPLVVALVRGGAERLGHSLTLTLLHGGGDQHCAGGGAEGAAGGGRPGRGWWRGRGGAGAAGAAADAEDRARALTAARGRGTFRLRILMAVHEDADPVCLPARASQP